VPLQAGKAVASVTLPNQPSLHLFALTVAGAATPGGASAVNLQPFYNNAGTASDGTAGGANLDGVGYAYSAQALRAAGVARGGLVVANGMTFQWPGATPGTADNVTAQGQTIALAAPVNGGVLGFLGAATHGPATGTGTITYGDGSTQPYTLTLSDWTLGGGGQAVAAGTSIAATMTYRDTSGGQADASKAYLFAASVPLQAGKAVASVTLPNQSSLHLFALAAAPAGGAANLQPFYNNAGMASDGMAGGANLDGVGYAYSAQALRAAGVARGGLVMTNGMTFQWPGAAPGTADNVTAQGQVVVFSAAQAGTFDGDMYRQTSPVSRTLYYVRDPGGRLLALTDGTTVYYYGLDGHGSVATLTDSSGAVVNTYRYDPYGNSLGKTETATLPNPWQYAGGYYDVESGLYLLGARYYAPTLGRFLQQDPLGSGNDSQYAYAGSDPCNNSDPTGLTVCYHHVTADEVHRKVYELTTSVNQLNEGAGDAATVAVVEVFIPGIGDAAAVVTVAIAGAATIASGKLGQDANVLQNGPDGNSGYYNNGFTVQYNSNFLWWNTPCAPGDTTSRPGGGYIVSGSPFDGFVPSH
jgi:RHS repeat-associated protein